MYYKVLKNDGSCVNGGKGKWHLPKGNKPGRWMPEIEGELELCENGYHICRREDLVNWLDEAIFEVEFKGEIIEGDGKCVVRKARLVRKLDTWNEKTARLFAADCAERVLPIFEREYPDDDRPRKAIQAARDFVDGKISRDELYAAGEAGYVAASAAWSAAGDSERAWQTGKLFEYLEE